MAEKVIADIESAIFNVSANEKDNIRAQLIPTIQNYKPQKVKPSYLQELNTLKSLKSDPDLVITLADKEPLLVIMDRSDYNNKLQNFFTETMCEIINKDPTDYTYKKIFKAMKNNNLPQYIRENIQPPKCSFAPLIHGYIKTHKDTLDIRPIVARFSSPTYFVERAFLHYFKHFISDHPFTLSSTHQLTLQLKDFSCPPDSKIYTIDIKSLYPSTPFFHTLQLFRKKLVEENKHTMEQIISIMDLLYLVQDNNIFQHEGVLYRQGLGVPMGSPISGYLSELLIQDLENRILPEYMQSIYLWRRYVDDILLICDKDLDVPQVLDKFTAIQSTIKFTTNIETSFVNFLDLSISFIDNTTPTVKIYRKPYDPLTLFHRKTNTSNANKWGAIRSHIIRALRYISLPQDLDDEIDFIRMRALQHGYSLPTFDKIHTQAKQIVTTNIDNLTPTANTISYRKIHTTHINNIISNTLKPANIRLVSDCNNSLGRCAVNTKPTNNSLLPGVYCIPVKLQDDTIAKYIGRTQSTLFNRIKQHQTDIRTNNIDATQLSHITLTEGAIPIWDKAGILHKTGTYIRGRFLEAYEQIATEDTINKHIDLDILRPWITAIKNKDFQTHYSRIQNQHNQPDPKNQDPD